MKRFTFTIALFVCTTLAIFAQADLQPLVNIKVNSNKPELITLKQLKSRVESYKLQSGMSSFTVEQKKEILNSMIDEKLVVQAAEKAGITFTDAQVNDYFLANMAQQIGQQLTEVQLAAIVREQTGMTLDDYIKSQVGMNLTEYKQYLKTQLIAQQYILSLKQNELMTVAPSDSEIRSFYELKKGDFYQSEILKLFLTIVPKNGDEKAARKKITSLLDQVRSNTLTPEKIKATTQGDKTIQAGDLYVSKTELSAQQLGLNYAALLDLFKKDNGFVSDLTETDTDFQFYIIRDKKDAKVLDLSDVIQPESTITVYEYIKQALTSQMQSQYVANVVQEITQKLRTPDNFVMIKSGDALDKLLADW